MGKKSRRQREGGAATGFLKPHKRFEDKHWRHKDGSPISDDETFELYMLLRTLPELREVREMGLKENSTKDDAAQQRRQEYMSLVVQRKVTTKGMPGAVRNLKRWPELQPHWPRIRRRICDQCGRRVALSEPRFMVCGGCGVARYCSEACQIGDWRHHQTCCAGLARYAAREEKRRAAANADPVDWKVPGKRMYDLTNGRFVHVDDF